MSRAGQNQTPQAEKAFEAMDILVASSSPYRQSMYRDAIARLEHQARVATSGVDCVQKFRMALPEMLILEAPLFWGGSDGVLEVAEEELGPTAPPVIVLAVGSGSIDWFQLSRFRIDDFLFRVPTLQELEQSIATVAERRKHEGSRDWQSRRSSLRSTRGVASKLASATPWSGMTLSNNSLVLKH